MLQIIYFAVFIISIVFIYNTFIKPTLIKVKPDMFANNKVLKYFGGSYCPHSRKGSRAYELIKDFETAYPDVKVEYFWTGGNTEEFVKADAQYVPTITNNLYNKVELSVNPNDDTKNKTELELKNMVMANIYKQV